MNDDFSFMSEKIKEKPFYKRKWVGIVLATIALAVVFGGISACVFVKVSSWVKEQQEQALVEEIEIPKDDHEQTEQEIVPEVTEEIAEATPVPEKRELTLEDYRKMSDEFQRIGTETGKSLVTVTAVQSDVDWFNESYEKSGKSFGMIIGDNGVELLVLTKYETVKGSDGIKITFADRQTVNGELKKYDVTTGFAIIGANLSDIPASTGTVITPASLGGSVNLSPGDPLLALGHADGSEGSMNVGILTSVHKKQSLVDGEYTLLVTDMMKNEGAEGVLVNTYGQIVGILGRDSKAAIGENVLTAYGISDLKNLIEHLSNNQDVTYLGIRGVTVTDSAKAEGIPAGVYVTEVETDSPAMLGGIQPGDVIHKINGHQVSTMKDVSLVLQKLSNKQHVTLEGSRLTKDGYKNISYETALVVLE